MLSPSKAGQPAEVAALVNDYQARARTRDFPAALEIAERIAAMQPASVQAQLRVATTLILSGRPQDAVALLHDVIRRKPTAAGAHAALGKALLRIGDVDAGIAAYGQAAAL